MTSILFQLYCVSADDDSCYERFFRLEDIDAALYCLDSYFSTGKYSFCALYVAINPLIEDDAVFRLVKSYEL